MTLGFIESKAYSNLCFKVEGRILVMLLLYVDDFLLTGKVELIKVARRRLAAYFKGLGYGGVVECGWNLLGQRKYAVEILKRFRMMECKAMTTPMELNLKLLSDASSEAVDATMCCQMIGIG